MTWGEIWQWLRSPKSTLAVLAAVVGVVALGGAIARTGLWSQETAAWVQAVGSIGAIAFAWHVGQRDGQIRAEREAIEERRLAEGRLGWLHSARATIEAAAIAVRMAEHAAAYASSGDGGLEVVAAELAAIPPDKLGHGRAIAMLTETRRSVATTSQQLRRIRSGGAFDPAVWKAMKDVTSSTQMEMVEICLRVERDLER